MSHFKQLTYLIQNNLKNQKGIHVYLFRNGQSLGNHTGSVTGWTDTKLSMKGRAQANNMFKAFHPLVDSFTTIQSSDLVRSKNTLELGLGFPMRQIKESKLLRQLNFGDQEGLHYDSLPQQQKSNLSSMNYKAPNGQSWDDVRERAIEYFKGLNNGHHLISTHGGLICALTYQLGIKQVIPNCSVIAAQLCQQNRNLKKIHFTWKYQQASL